jgi:hypothetical protein
MRSTRLLISIVAVGTAASLGPGGCSCNSSSSSSPPAQGDDAGDDSGQQTTPDGGGSEASTPVEAGGATEAGTPTEAGTVSEAGSGTVSDAGPPPDIDAAPTATYNVCPDTSPTNTSFTSAYTLGLDAYGFGALTAGVVTDSDEYFVWTPPKHDPTHVWVSYTVPSASSDTQLSLVNYNASHTNIADDPTSRTGLSQTLETYFETNGNQSIYFTDVGSNETTCQPFNYYVDALFCTDQYEDNDTETTPAPLTFATTQGSGTTWATANVSINGTINDLDDDYYSVVAPLSDPMSASVSYTVAATESEQLGLVVYDPSDTNVGDDPTERSGTSQTLNVVWEAKKQATYVVYVSSGNSTSNAVCTANTVAVNGLWCTDNYEDNDTISTPATLPDTSSTPATATISSLDDDYYTLPDSAQTLSGTCTVTYTVPTTSDQQLNIVVYDSQQTNIGDDGSPTQVSSSGGMTTWQLAVDWSTSTYSAETLYVSAGEEACTQYTITCSAD